MIKPGLPFWEVFKKTSGALSTAECTSIVNLAAQAPEGLWLEMGTFKGKSAMAAIYGGNAPDFILLEPLFGSEVDCNELAKNISDATGKGVKLYFINGYSTDFLKDTKDMYAYVMSDAGNHQDGLPMAEVKLLEDRLLPGGVIAFHDFGNQFREPKEAAEYLVSTGKYEWIDIPWAEIVEYVKENNLEEGNNSWHVYDDVPYPCFVGAVKRK